MRLSGIFKWKGMGEAFFAAGANEALLWRWAHGLFGERQTHQTGHGTGLPGAEELEKVG